MSAVFLASLLIAAPALAQYTGSGECTDVHVFLAKGWNEQYTDQRQTKLVDAICSSVGSSCDYEDIVLNNLAGSDYCTAVTAANGAGKFQIQAYAAKCPSSKLVLSGYSEGAQVVGDIMAGGGGNYDSACTPTSAIDASSDAFCQISAVMMFGNPRHVANAAYNTDSGVAGVGSFPRTAEQAGVLASYGSMIHDWCNINDPVCAEGLGTNQAEPFHTNYFDLVTGDAAAWAVSKINVASSCSKTSSSSSSSMSSTSSSMTTSSSTSSMASTSAEAKTSFTEATMTSSSVAVSAPAGYGSTTVSMTASMPASYPASYPTTSAAANMTSSMMSYSSAAPTSVTTMISGKPACVSYAVASSMTTYGPYPEYPVSSSYPVTTSWIGWGNGTATMTGAMGSGSAAPSGTGATTKTGSDMPSYTGAAGNVKIAGGFLAAAVGVVGMMIA